MKVFCFWYIFLISKVVFGQDVEYYPSQSILDTYKVDVKREIANDDTIDMLNCNNKTSNKKIKWRNFNEQSNESNATANVQKRAVDTVFHGYPKTREELWSEHFLNESSTFDQTPSLVKLLHNVTMTYLQDCTPVILYDNLVKSKESYLLQNLLKGFPKTFVHGYINDDDELEEPKLLHAVSDCLHYIIFLSDVKKSAKVLGMQSESKVIVVARSSQWAVQEFLAGPLSRMFVNLLVIGQSLKEGDDASLVSKTTC